MNYATYTLALLLTALLFSANPASAQRATEVYIPIGESPGVSGDKSWAGEIRSVDYAAHEITIQTDEGLQLLRVNDATRYYLDRTGQRRQNSAGHFDNCRAGQKIEVKVSGNNTAEWIKIKTL